MKATGRVCSSGIILGAIFFAFSPFTALGAGTPQTQAVSTESVAATKVCIRNYGKTTAEAFKIGAKLMEEADAQLGKGKQFNNIQMRILPEKENGMFVVEVYSVPDSGTCATQTNYKTAQVIRQ